MHHVGIDITSLLYDRGVSRYTHNLVRALARRHDIALKLFGSSWRQQVLLEKRARDLLLKRPNRLHEVAVQPWPPTLLAWLWRFNQAKVSSLFEELDVIHSWDWLQPPDKNIPLVSTIHDLAIIKFPDTAHPDVLAAHRRSWDVLRERQARIIAVSQATKRDIVELLQIPAYQITVIPEALPIEIRETARALNDNDELYYKIKRKLNLTQPYLFFVGTREPRKNLMKLIEAWQPLANQIQLIIAGAAGWDATSTQTFEHPNLRFLGKVSDAELEVLYNNAEVFVYPSIYEGFGLPILEAFYHLKPVVAANIPAIAEVAGNAAELVDPHDAQAIREAIIKLLNETKEEQQKRAQRMIIRGQMFSWDSVATATMEVYKQAIEERS